MLVDFYVENFGPFREMATIDLVQKMPSDASDNMVSCGFLEGEVLTSALVFGPNSSGKSSLVKAIRALQEMVSVPVPPEFDYPWYQPFRLSEETASAPTFMYVRVMVDETLYGYCISYDRNSVVYESLHKFEGRHKSAVFVREGNEFKFGRSQSKGQKSISAVTSRGSAYLAVAAQFNNQACLEVHREITQNICVLADDRGALVKQTVSMMEADGELKDMVVRALELADLGIVDVKLERDGAYAGQPSAAPPYLQSKAWPADRAGGGLRVWIQHEFGDADRREGALMPLEMESEGTWQILGIAGPLVDALRRGKVLVVDEFGSNLHPLVARWIVSLFSNGHNPNHAQLIAATNDHSLLDVKSLLRRDQVFFTHRDSRFGDSIVYCLSECDTDQSDDVLSTALPRLYHSAPYVSDEDLLKRSRQF